VIRRDEKTGSWAGEGPNFRTARNLPFDKK
jgi:hypothetical protein